MFPIIRHLVTIIERNEAPGTTYTFSPMEVETVKSQNPFGPSFLTFSRSTLWARISAYALVSG